MFLDQGLIPEHHLKRPGKFAIQPGNRYRWTFFFVTKFLKNWYNDTDLNSRFNHQAGDLTHKHKHKSQNRDLRSSQCVCINFFSEKDFLHKNSKIKGELTISLTSWSGHGQVTFTKDVENIQCLIVPYFIQTYIFVQNLLKSTKNHNNKNSKYRMTKVLFSFDTLPTIYWQKQYVSLLLAAPTRCPNYKLVLWNSISMVSANIILHSLHKNPWGTN